MTPELPVTPPAHPLPALTVPGPASCLRDSWTDTPASSPAASRPWPPTPPSAPKSSKNSPMSTPSSTPAPPPPRPPPQTQTRTGGGPMTQPPPDLTEAVFRALYQDYELRTHGAVHIVTPKGTPVYISASLGQIARHLSTPQLGPTPPGPSLPARRPGPKHACSPRSTCRSCGTNPAARPPSTPRSPRPPSARCLPFSTRARTDTMTLPNQHRTEQPMWRICSSPR
jgi:hypothetical protein